MAKVVLEKLERTIVYCNETTNYTLHKYARISSMQRQRKFDRKYSLRVTKLSPSLKQLPYKEKLELSRLNKRKRRT
jgi:hypothetical protein